MSPWRSRCNLSSARAAADSVADCSFFLADRRDRDRALKRGGGRAPVPIDARDAEGRFLHEPAHRQTPERLFERDWALALLGRVFVGWLQAELAASGRVPDSGDAPARARVARICRIWRADPDLAGVRDPAALE